MTVVSADDNCAERNQVRVNRCIFPLFCEPDQDCDCDRACCPDCGKKKPREKKHLLSCFACKEPPRGATAVSLPARLAGFANPDAPGDTESARFRNKRTGGVGAETQADEGIDGAGSVGGRTELRLSRLESDLNGLTLLVEKLAESQSRQERDLTNNTLLLERIADRIKSPAALPNEALPPAAIGAGEAAPPSAGVGGPQGGDY
jgi:hypothetical protein